MGRKKKKDAVSINAPVAYVTAAEMLEAARYMAVEHKDYHALIDIANAWSEIGNNLLVAEVELVLDEDSAIASPTHQQHSIGFGFTGDPNGKKEVKPPEQPSQD